MKNMMIRKEEIKLSKFIVDKCAHIKSYGIYEKRKPLESISDLNI